jgi:carbamate kinase
MAIGVAVDSRMRLVVALGGNALLRRGDQLTAETQLENVRLACDEIAPVASEHELVLCHGNGPQVGLLALQAATYEHEAHLRSYPLDILEAQAQGMIGYMLERELGNRLPFDRPIAALLTMIEVDAHDPAFAHPTKFIGPVYENAEAVKLVNEKGWTFKRDGDAYRRVVPSPRPMRIFELRQIRWLLDRGSVVVCAGGGGIPTTYMHEKELVGVEAVIDKDHASGLLARDIGADWFVMATDVDAVYLDWDTPSERAIARAHPDALMEIVERFPAGSMGPKVVAACEFVKATENAAAIGSLTDVAEMIAGTHGTVCSTNVQGIEFRAA